MTDYVSKPLPLSGACNVRDLGGYGTADGRITCDRQFLRADSLHALGEADKEFLYDYGVRLVIDLRDVREIELCPFSLPESICYRNIPLYDAINSNMLKGEFPSSLRELYIGRLLEDSRKNIAQVLRTAAEGDSCVLFNCTAGKDRTGVIAMLLLLLAGVKPDLIVADYAATEGNMKQLFALQLAALSERGISGMDYLFTSRPEEMAATLSHVQSSYGGAAPYCRGIGLTESCIARLREKLLG